MQLHFQNIFTPTPARPCAPSVTLAPSLSEISPQLDNFSLARPGALGCALAPAGSPIPRALWLPAPSGFSLLSHFCLVLSALACRYRRTPAFAIGVFGGVIAVITAFVVRVHFFPFVWCDISIAHSCTLCNLFPDIFARRPCAPCATLAPACPRTSPQSRKLSLVHPGALGRALGQFSLWSPMCSNPLASARGQVRQCPPSGGAGRAGSD